MGACDICNAKVGESDSHRLSSSEFRRIVGNGFNPFNEDIRFPTGFRLSDLGAAFGLSAQEQYRDWMSRALASSSDWVLCGRCFTFADRFTAQAEREVQQAAPDALEQITGKRPAVPGSGCFIATVCYGSPDCAEVSALRAFRDQILIKSCIGRLLVACYYRVSPPLVKWLHRWPGCRLVVRKYLIEPLIERLPEGIDRPNKSDSGDGR